MIGLPRRIIVGPVLAMLVATLLSIASVRACPGSSAAYYLLSNVPIPASDAPIVAKITAIDHIEAKAPKRAIVFARINEVAAGSLRSQVKIAVRIQGLCDEGPEIGSSGYVKGEMKGDELWVISARCEERMARKCN